MAINLAPVRQVVEMLRTKIRSQWDQIGVLQRSVYALTDEIAVVQGQLATAMTEEPAQLAEIEAQTQRANDAEAAKVLAQTELTNYQATAEAEIAALEQQLASLVTEPPVA
jgi:predicted  nucleic acid-binding Zn-ribbon protein